MISKVCGGGKGTVSGDVVASSAGLSGAAEDLGSGVAAVGDLDAICKTKLEADQNPREETWRT